MKVKSVKVHVSNTESKVHVEYCMRVKALKCMSKTA